MMSQPNSRPELELEQLIKNGVFTVERDRGGDYMLGYLIERDVTYIKQLIAQEADKLANKRVREELLNLRSQFEMMPWEVAGTMSDPMLGARTPEEIEAGREKNRTYGFASRYAYDKINDHIKELDKGDSHEDIT
jgi:hypothetical protein